MSAVTALSDDRRPFSSRLRFWIPFALAAAAFFVYAAAALSVSADQWDDFVPERSSIAAALSHLAYKAPLGKVYFGVLAQLLDFNTPLHQTLAQAAQREIPGVMLLGSTADGNGIGFMMIADVSTRLLGPHTSSLVVAMLVLMGASALAFLMRFRRQYAIVVTLYFAALTVILFTPLTWDRNYALNVGIASIRYFSVLAILPAFHLFLELADPRVARRTLAPLALMAVQVVILVLSVLVRNSAAPIVAAMAVGGLFFAWKYRGYPGATEQIFGKAARMALIALAFVGVLALSVSRDYLGAGRFTETIWHRIYVSLGINPEWPFGNLREVYDCPPYMALVPGTEDRNGHCTFFAYAKKHGIPINVAVTMTYGDEYDAALREALFDIARLYPAEALKTFLWYKPLYIYNSLAESLDVRPWAPQSPSPWLLAAAILNVIAFGLFVPPTRVRLIAYAIVIFASCSTLPYLAVWAMPHTSIDLLFYCIFA